MPHYPPAPGRCQGKKVGIWIMQNSNAPPIGHASQSNPYHLPPKTYKDSGKRRFVCKYTHFCTSVCRPIATGQIGQGQLDHFYTLIQHLFSKFCNMASRFNDVVRHYCILIYSVKRKVGLTCICILHHSSFGGPMVATALVWWAVKFPTYRASFGVKCQPLSPYTDTLGGCWVASY